MRFQRWIILALILVAASCAKQAKPTPPPVVATPAPVLAPASIPEKVMLTVKVQVTKSNLNFSPDVFSRSRKSLNNLKGVFVRDTSNAQMTESVVSIDVKLPYKPGTATNLGSFRYHIFDKDASSAAISTPFAVAVDGTKVTSNYTYVTPIYPVSWTNTNGGK